jgi:glycosyltransferase involved in cell wall biosynthesis
LKRRLLGRPAIAAHRLAIALLRVLPRARGTGTGTGTGAVHLLLTNAYGMGGTIRSTFNLAAALSASRAVEIVSVRKHQARPALPFPEGVAVRVLDDKTQPRGLLARVPSLLVHPEDRSYADSSLLTDLQLVRALRGMGGDVIITTRPAFAIIAAAVAPRGTRVVAQEHLHIRAHGRSLQRALRRAYRDVDVVTVLTEADRRALGRVGARVERIPPLHAAFDDRRSTTERRVVVAAGRLVHQKGFDLLIRAFADVEAPEWELRIYGTGKERDALQAQIGDDRVRLMGPTDDLGAVLAEAGLFALSSRWEGFGMVVVEAMAHGVPVVSFDCPHGPGETITHGEDGLLVPPEDVGALSAALGSLVADPQRRARMGAAARVKAQNYAPAAVAERWTELLDSL